jgi:hypothetical protein
MAATTLENTFNIIPLSFAHFITNLQALTRIISIKFSHSASANTK